ncbi:hypothetical protein ACQKIW_28480 [Bacillus thuringiensis]|uniref:hypothetical protein n=1 Tax=Bacillus thuringiensis TaxID=1428 RepID=UPI003D07B873
MLTNIETITATDLSGDIQINSQVLNTNLKFNQNKTKQKFLIHGPKFFDGLFKQLRTEDEAGELPASALAVYIGLHYMVNDIGLLPSDFTVTQIATTIRLPYTTAYTGFQILLQRKLVQEKIIHGLPIYEISNYALNNRTKNEGNMEYMGLSYFRLPHTLLDTTILCELVTHRDRKGIHLLLDLCNAFTRQLGTTYKKSLEQYTLVRRMNFLKKYLNKNAKKIREYVSLLSPIFQIEATHTIIRKARESRLTRIRKALNQVVIPKYTIRLVASCVLENTDADIKQLEAKMRKEAVSRLKSIGYALSNKDRRDLVVSFQSEISKIAYLIENKIARAQLMTYSMCYALDQVEVFVKKTREKIESIGAFVRVKLRESLPSWRITYLNDHERHELMVAFGRQQLDIPEWLHMHYSMD